MAGKKPEPAAAASRTDSARAARPMDRSGAKWGWNDILMLVALVCVCWYPVSAGEALLAHHRRDDRFPELDITRLPRRRNFVGLQVRYYFAGGVVAPSLLRQSLEGRTYIVTGANTGIGYETSLQLAKQGATVVMAGRSMARLQGAVSSIKAEVPTARVEPEILDLESFESVRAFAAGFKAKHDRLNGLVNNAGASSAGRLYVQTSFS